MKAKYFAEGRHEARAFWNFWNFRPYFVRASAIRPYFARASAIRTCAMAYSFVCERETWIAFAFIESKISFALPVRIKEGAPDSLVTTSTSCQVIPPLQPVPSAFNAASFAAKRAAKDAAALAPFDSQ